MRRRLLLSHLTVALVLIVLFEVPLALVYSRHEHDAVDTALQRDAVAVAAYLAMNPPASTAVFASSIALHDELIIAVDEEGHEVTAPSVLSNDAHAAAILERARHGLVTGEFEDLVYDAVPASNGGAVLVARGDEVVDAKVHRAWWALFGAGIALLAVAAFVSTQVSRRLAQPIARLERTAAAIGDGALTARADESKGPREITALARTLNRMAVQLDELLSSQKRFVADASHQLRSPLTALRLRLEGWPEDAPPSADEREATFAELARLSRIVDGLLALARAEGTRSERSNVDVASALRDRFEAWSPLAEEQGVELLVNAPPSLRTSVVEGHVEQILDNLIDNALAACAAGDSIELRGLRSDGRVQIAVTDSGRGMTEDERAHAFDPFWRGTHEFSGSGLGLAIVEQLARTSGGTVTLEQSPAGGVDARVTFDAAP